jgi:hypothetical protein
VGNPRASIRYRQDIPRWSTPFQHLTAWNNPFFPLMWKKTGCLAIPSAHCIGVSYRSGVSRIRTNQARSWSLIAIYARNLNDETCSYGADVAESNDFIYFLEAVTRCTYRFGQGPRGNVVFGKGKGRCIYYAADVYKDKFNRCSTCCSPGPCLQYRRCNVDGPALKIKFKQIVIPGLGPPRTMGT